MTLAGWLLVSLAGMGQVTTLPDTQPLQTDRPLDEHMIDGLQRFCLRTLAEAPRRRDELWQRSDATGIPWRERQAAARQRLREILGAVDPRLTESAPRRHQFELLATLQNSSRAGRTSTVTAHYARWPVLSGVSAEGLVLVPERVRAAVIVVPDAAWTPELCVGLAAGATPALPFAQRLAAAGCFVVIPSLLSRDDEWSGHPEVGFTNLTHREFLYRQAFEVGRHPLGYELQKVLAAVDLCEQRWVRQGDANSNDPIRLAVAGVGDGALVALHAAALDDRLASALVSGYFQPRESLWREPVDRNVWRLLTEFGDAELAGLAAPKRLVIEACAAPEVSGPPAVRSGRRSSAAPGRITSPKLQDVKAEVARAREFAGARRVANELKFVASDPEGRGTAGSTDALAAFVEPLRISDAWREPFEPWRDVLDSPPDARSELHDPQARERRQFDELQTHVQTLVRRSPSVRDQRWGPTPANVEAWQQRRVPLRDRVHEQLIGKLADQRLPPNPRTRLLRKTDRYRVYEVLLDVYPDVIAAGILAIPNDCQPDERRPVVVCQHGLEGLASDVFSRDEQAFRYYQAFGEVLCEQGYVVYAPQNPYRGQDRFRVLQRQANPLGRSLFSFIVAQHQQTLDWLAALPIVDRQRIAFYGLSYGGKTAMRVPPLVDGYCLSICSGDFTDWARTIATNDDRYGYAFTTEYEIPEWNLAHEASYAELAMLLAPRPFLVEQGHRDGGAPTEWVAGEFGRVRRFYDQLGIGSRAEIAFFDGPHTIHGEAAYRFLARHLEWRQK